jgi:23S rRNA pseudouridine2605 synthase
MRLQRFLSQAGVAARRKAEELIVAGRVTVNGKIVRELGTKVDPINDHVQVDGEAVATEEPFYVLLNKPKGCITAVSDDRGRPTVMDYLPNLPVSVAPVGRLDFYSEGVLLLTNDGELAAKLLAPKSHVPKTYHVKIFGQIRPAVLQAMRDGVTLDDGTVTQPAEIVELPAESKHTWLAITLYEGKSRQIHRMLEQFGYQVTKLQRVAFGNLTHYGLRVGDARELSQLEVNELRELVGLDRRNVSRGRWRASREQTDIQRRAAGKKRAEAAALAEAGPASSGPFPSRRQAPAPPRSKGAPRPPSKPRPKPQPRTQTGSGRGRGTGTGRRR